MRNAVGAGTRVHSEIGVWVHHARGGQASSRAVVGQRALCIEAGDRQILGEKLPAPAPRLAARRSMVAPRQRPPPLRPVVGLRLQSLPGPGSRHCYGIIALIETHRDCKGILFSPNFSWPDARTGCLVPACRPTVDGLPGLAHRLASCDSEPVRPQPLLQITIQLYAYYLRRC